MDLEVVAGRQLSIALSMIVPFSKYPWISLNISSYSNSKVVGPGLSLAHIQAAGRSAAAPRTGWSRQCPAMVSALQQIRPMLASAQQDQQTSLFKTLALLFSLLGDVGSLE